MKNTNTKKNNTNVQMNTKQKIAGCYLPAILLFILLLFLDQLTKYIVYTKMNLYDSIKLWDGVFHFTYIQNKGAAWGMFEEKQIIFVIFAIIVLVLGIIFYIRCVNRNIFKDIRFLTILILAGAIGNMIDRIRFHYVVDFLYFKLIDFPVFNVADCYVTIGFFTLIYLVLFKYKDEDFEKLK